MTTPNPRIRETGAPPPIRRMRPNRRPSPPRLSPRALRLVRNGAWLLIPVLVPELFLRGRLPLVIQLADPGLPLLLVDAVLQALTYAMAFFLVLDAEGRPGRLGVATYAIGVTATVSAWMVGLLGAPAAPGLTCPSGLGVAVSPLLCFIGMATLGRSPTYAVFGVALTLVRLFSTLPPGLCAA